MKKETKVPRRNGNPHAKCKDKPCAYCAALKAADLAFAGREPDSPAERERDGRTGPYAG